jgi:hypothetical protein
MAGDDLHEFLILQANERFPNRRSAHPEFDRQLVFEHLVGRGVLVIENAAANFAIRLIDKRLSLAFIAARAASSGCPRRCAPR